MKKSKVILNIGLILLCVISNTNMGTAQNKQLSHE